MVRTVSAVAALAILAPGAAWAGKIQLKLDGWQQATGENWGYGDDGLYLGDDWSTRYPQYENWSWDGIMMDIDKSTGDAHIYGDMTRGDGSVWGLNIYLTGVQYKGGYNEITHDIYWDLEQMGVHKAGLEWANLEMSLTSPYDTSVPLENWVGLPMPDIGHPNSAELLWHADRGLVYEHWVQNPINEAKCEPKSKKKKKKKSGGYCYDVGDTKAKVRKKPMQPIPEPSAALVFATGALVTGMAARRRS